MMDFSIWEVLNRSASIDFSPPLIFITLKIQANDWEFK